MGFFLPIGNNRFPNQLTHFLLIISWYYLHSSVQSENPTTGDFLNLKNEKSLCEHLKHLKVDHGITHFDFLIGDIKQHLNEYENVPQARLNCLQSR